MKAYKNNKAIEVMGVSFKGVKDMTRHALDNIPKDGVFVGIDARRYPCFDSSDYAYEDRYYTNLVFAKSKEELDEKMARLKSMEQIRCNYDKLTEELHPMAYWGGDCYYDVFLTEGQDNNDVRSV